MERERDGEKQINLASFVSCKRSSFGNKYGDEI